MAKHTTISVDKQLYDEYKKYSDKEGFNIKKRVEKLIREDMNELSTNIQSDNNKS